MYLPEPVLTAVDIAEESGLPKWAVREKLGIIQKRMADSDDHPNQMAIWAAQGRNSDDHRWRRRRLCVGCGLRQVGTV
jgi:hypothetical protein